MRVLLVNPPTPLAERPNPPLGLAFVAAALEEAGVTCRILDLVTHPLDHARLVALLEEFKPDIAGATAVTMNYKAAREVIQEIKHIAPEVVTVMGGPHVTFSTSETLTSTPELDLIVMGEGDVTVVDLVRELESGRRDWNEVRGVAFRGADGEMVVTPAQDVVDVNTLSQPARHLLPLGRYRALRMPISITTARGCPFPCIFCSARDMAGAKIRNRTADIVVDELEDLAGLGFHQINFADDLFTGRKKHCMAVCDEILARGLKITWSCYSRVDTISPEMLAKMRQAGCTTMAFGIESANAEILKAVRKGITIAKTLEAIEMCVEAGIDPHCSFIFGLPGETKETMAETLEFCQKISAMGASYGIHLLAPFPGTAVREMQESFDLEILTDDWSEYHANRAIVRTAGVTADELNEAVDEWTRNLEAYMEASRANPDTELAKIQAEGLENLDRIIFYHALMMSAGLEDRGHWAADGATLSDEDALVELARRVHADGDKTPEEAGAILAHAFGERHIIRRDVDGEVRFLWNDRLEGVADSTPTMERMAAIAC
jgi:anaerobic magnesium-protoporphyrin IX monomethyl ester cyclase